MTATAAPEVTEVELAIGGMTCAACAARVQAKLNKVDGVTASVNLSTERAHVTAPAHLPASDLIAVVEGAGYSADLASRVSADAEMTADEAAVRRLRRRLILALVFFVPLTDLSLMLSLIPSLRFAMSGPWRPLTFTICPSPRAHPWSRTTTLCRPIGRQKILVCRAGRK